MRLAGGGIGDALRLVDAEEPALAVFGLSTRRRCAMELIAWRKLMASARVSSISVGPAGSSIMAAATSSEAISG